MAHRSRSSVTLASIVITALSACGGSVATIGPSSSGGSGTAVDETSTGTGTGTGTQSVDAAVDARPVADAGKPKEDAGPNDPACPKSFEMPAGNCKEGLRCAYPEGTCSCVGYCGGVPPPPDVDFTHWSCTPKAEDACPDERPEQGAACKDRGTICNYGECCVQTFTCGQSGKWTSGPMQCPP